MLKGISLKLNQLLGLATFDQWPWRSLNNTSCDTLFNEELLDIDFVGPHKIVTVQSMPTLFDLDLT